MNSPETEYPPTLDFLVIRASVLQLMTLKNINRSRTTQIICPIEEVYWTKNAHLQKPFFLKKMLPGIPMGPDPLLGCRAIVHNQSMENDIH